MNSRSLAGCERTKIEKWSRFQLSNSWKKVGIALAIGLVLIGMVIKFTGIELDWFKEILRRGILVGLLIIILSKEKEEDEMVGSLRSKAYGLAFIFGVGFALVQPLLEFVLHNYVFEASASNGFSYFEILFYMLIMQIMCFEILKRNR